jgi:hypothetical protein
LSLNRWNYVHSNPVRYVDPTGNIEEDYSEAKKALEIVQLLRAKYSVRIAVDWGYYGYGTGELTRVLPVQNPVDGHLYTFGQCWHKGQWIIKDLEAIKAALEIASGGVHALGGHFNSLIGPVKIVPEKWNTYADPASAYFDKITYRIKNNSSQAYRLWAVIHELGHVVTYHHNFRSLAYFMTELETKCSNQPWWKDVRYCNSNQQPGVTYDPGRYAGDKFQYMPSSYAMVGSFEDFAETWKEVVMSAYVSTGGIWVNDAKHANEFFSANHNIRERRTVMTKIINGSWR